MRFDPPLQPATLLRRYKRFLADIRLPDGTEVTAHCPNSGRMTACQAPGIPCRVSFHDNPKRKLKWTLEQTRMEPGWILVNTGLPNKVVEEGIRQGRVPELSGYAVIEREKKRGDSRLDLRLSDPDRPRCWVEVKNVTLVRDGVASFPDAVSARATKHLQELGDIAEAGERAVLFFHVGRPDGTRVEPARDVDPVYAEALERAVGRGVEVLAYRAFMDDAIVELRDRVEVRVRPG